MVNCTRFAYNTSVMTACLQPQSRPSNITQTMTILLSQQYVTKGYINYNIFNLQSCETTLDQWTE